MPLDRCLFAVRVEPPAALPEVERRAEALVRFYAPLGAKAPAAEPGGAGTSWRFVAPATTLVGAIGFDGARPDLDQLLVFGEGPPPGTTLRGAIDAELRRLDGIVAVVETGEDGVTLVTGASGPTGLYEASANGTTAWSTHAVAAGWLARGSVELDAGALPEFLAAEFVGGSRTLLAGVSAVPAATAIELTSEGAAARCWWPASERWALLHPAAAQEHGESALLETLERRLRNSEHTFLGLTAGLDSRAAALALRELGLPFEAYTWGEQDWPDVSGGAEVAAAVGVRHHFQPFELFADDDALRFVEREVRWNEGLIQVGFGQPTWPAGMSTFVTGAGGETGRCFYYRSSVHLDVTPDAGHLAQVMSAALAGRIGAAHPGAIDTLHGRLDEWIADAESSGLRGWRCLDVLYAEQRVRRWLRGMLPRSRAPMVPAFTAPEIQRALVSLPLTERAEDAFQRKFIASRAPDLEPPAPPPPARAGLPPIVRRLRARLPGLPGRSSRQPSPLEPYWQERPAFRAWVAEEVLGSALIADALGERWAKRTRDRFVAGDAHAEEIALWAGGPVALQKALRDLRHG